MRDGIEYLTRKSNKMERQLKRIEYQFERIEYQFERVEALLYRLAHDRALSQNSDECHSSDSDSLKGEE